MAASTRSQSTYLRVLLLPVHRLGPEAACWESLHTAYRDWMLQTRTYTVQSVGVLHALSLHTWDAHEREWKP